MAAQHRSLLRRSHRGRCPRRRRATEGVFTARRWPVRAHDHLQCRLLQRLCCSGHTSWALAPARAIMPTRQWPAKDLRLVFTLLSPR